MTWGHLVISTFVILTWHEEKVYVPPWQGRYLTYPSPRDINSIAQLPHKADQQDATYKSCGLRLYTALPTSQVSLPIKDWVRTPYRFPNSIPPTYRDDPNTPPDQELDTCQSPPQVRC